MYPRQRGHSGPQPIPAPIALVKPPRDIVVYMEITDAMNIGKALSVKRQSWV
jgi:hypothetical protein